MNPNDFLEFLKLQAQNQACHQTLLIVLIVLGIVITGIFAQMDQAYPTRRR